MRDGLTQSVSPDEDDMLEKPPLPTVVLCVRPGPLLTKLELPEVPRIVPELTAWHDLHNLTYTKKGMAAAHKQPLR